jgi:hypothetical protein
LNKFLKWLFINLTIPLLPILITFIIYLTKKNHTDFSSLFKHRDFFVITLALIASHIAHNGIHFNEKKGGFNLIGDIVIVLLFIICIVSYTLISVSYSELNT